MPGEVYVQCILNQLNEIEVKGRDNLNRLLTAIGLLERLKDDIVAHKAKDGAEIQTDNLEGTTPDQLEEGDPAETPDEGEQL